MYIPIGPSKKQLYKLLFFMFLCLISLTMFKGCVKAETLTVDYGLNTNGLVTSTQNYNVFPTFNSSGNIFVNKSGELVFTFYYAIDISGGELPYEVYVSSNNQVFECSIGSYIFSNNSANQRATITAICNVNFDSSGWKSIGVNTRGTGTKYFLFSEYATISSNSGGSSGDISNQLQSIYNRLDTIGNDLYTIQEYYYRNINTTLTNLYNLISQNNSNISVIADNTTNINNSINDSSVDNNQTNSTISDLASGIHSNGTITNLLTLPITFIQRLVNGFNGSCRPFVIGTLWGSEISLSCIDISSFGAIFNIVDIFVSGFLAYAFGCKMIKLFNKFTNMKEGGLEEAYD